MHLYRLCIHLHDDAHKFGTMGVYLPGLVHPSPLSRLEHLSEAFVVLPDQVDTTKGAAIFSHGLGEVK